MTLQADPGDRSKSCAAKRARTLVIIPAYNEAGALPLVLANLEQQASGICDVVVINDGSKDATGEVARSCRAHCIDLPFNLGIGNAVHTGYLYAHRNGYQYAVQFDGDGQHPAECLEAIVSELARGEADMVIGSRFITGEGFQSSAMRRIGISFISRLIRLLTGRKISDPTSGFRGVNRRALELFVSYYPHDYPEPEAIVLAIKSGLKIKEIPVQMVERRSGRSSIGAAASLLYMAKVSLAIWVRSLTRSA